MTKEPPKGLRANLIGSYLSLPDDYFTGCSRPEELRKLYFALAFFHAIIQERRKFGALGWNVPYVFNQSDLDICKRQLRHFIEEYDEIPFEALSYTAAELNYGGRITDDKDRRLCVCILSDFYTRAVLRAEKGYKFSPSGRYSVPVADKLSTDDVMTYIRELPLHDPPEVFGLHENADITCAHEETFSMFATLLSLQPRTASGSSRTAEDEAARVTADIQRRLPPAFDLAAASAKFPIAYLESMHTVLTQELRRFNLLLATVASSLTALSQALQGLLSMSSELEPVIDAIFDGRVPEMWSRRSYPSKKPLGSWVTELLARVEFFRRWTAEGQPACYWLSGFFFPQGFLTGTSQNYARRHKLAIDLVRFDFEVVQRAPSVLMPPEEGCYVHGLYIEGCRWDTHTSALGESLPKQLFSEIPVVWFKPTAAPPGPTARTYNAPTYKTTARRGTLTTTGHSTNFVLYIRLPSRNPEAHWLKRGVALFCSLDD